MDAGNSQHTNLRAHCGICGRVLLAGVSFVPLLGVSGDSTPILDRATFPENESRLTSHGRLLCWLPNCWRCGHAPEAVGVHSDCLSVFQKVCKAEDALDRLWVAAARSPWRGAPNLHLGCATNLAVELVYERSRVYGIPCLRLLPPELIEMIRDYSESATFWRHISALSFGIELSTTPAQTASPSLATSIPLCDILAWTRGQEPTLVQPPDRSPVIRLTIDYRGIRQVERLPRKSQYQQFRSDNMAFAIEDEDQLKDIIVQFKYNILRLELPEKTLGFHIWDMPNPPDWKDCRFSGHVPQSTRFLTIDLRGVTGLTFFFSFSKVYAVHAHTPAMPYATRTFENLSKRRQAGVAWVYLPIPKGEDIIALGVRLRQQEGRLKSQQPCFLLRTKLAGDLTLGPCHQGEYSDLVLSELQPRLFIYNTVDLGPATVFGAYSQEPGDGTPFVPFRRRRFDSTPFQHANLLSAPLQDIVRIRVFEDEGLGFCRAILFDYANGAQRAVGNCRLGIDAVKTYLNPSRICYLATEYPQVRSSAVRRAVRVEGSCELTHHHDEEDNWVCSAMEGSLDFWFSEEESVIAITVEADDESI